MTTALSSGLVVVGVLLFFSILRAGVKRPARCDPVTGDLVLQCGSILVWSMGIIAVAGPLSMAILSFVIPFKNQREVLIPIGIGAFFLILGGVICFWVIRRRTRISARGLMSEYMLASPRFVPWEKVTKVSFSDGQEFWIHASDGSKAMLHVLLFIGVREVVPYLTTHLPKEVQREYKEVIDRFIKATGERL